MLITGYVKSTEKEKVQEKKAVFYCIVALILEMLRKAGAGCIPLVVYLMKNRIEQIQPCSYFRTT